jgi:hypothetical protein
MEELGKTNNSAWFNEAMQQQAGRMQSLIDMLYLVNVTWLYVFSLIYPLFGIIFGVILLQGSISQQGKKLGRTCLILGIVNIALVVIFFIIFALVGGFISKMIPYTI